MVKMINFMILKTKVMMILKAPLKMKTSINKFILY